MYAQNIACYLSIPLSIHEHMHAHTQNEQVFLAHIHRSVSCCVADTILVCRPGITNALWEGGRGREGRREGGREGGRDGRDERRDGREGGGREGRKEERERRVYDFSVLISYSVLLDIAMRAYLYYHAHCTNNSRMHRYSIAVDFPCTVW